jgi:uncharacterized protein (TIGR02271 family)
VKEAAMVSREQLLGSQGAAVLSQQGDKIGTVQDIYLDNDTNEPEWALVNTGLLGGRSSFVPLAQATTRGDDIVVPYDKDKVKDAPTMEEDGQLSQQEEAGLYEYYGLSYSEAPSDSGLPAEGVSGRTGDDAMTRSEEEIQLAKTQREAGRARLRKHVVTEDVQETVPVQRERARIEREPITEANVDAATSGPEISEDEHEVSLQQEEVVAEKRVVPKERVRLGKESVTEEAQVSDQVRKEQVEQEGDVPR